MEERLAGGVGNGGRVVRIGASVHRPSGPHARAIHWFLAALNSIGFDGASIPLGTDDAGREVFEFIEGSVAVPPYPTWVQQEDALRSITELLARLHQASAKLDAAGHEWSNELADPLDGSIVCHNDVCLENVVFRGNAAVGLIDFDYAAPGRPIYDLAQFAKMCVPLDRPERITRLGWSEPDQTARLRLIADVYGLSSVGRIEFLSAIGDAMAVGERFVERHFHAGEEGFVSMVEQQGGLARWKDQQLWWTDQRARFEQALL